MVVDDIKALLGNIRGPVQRPFKPQPKAEPKGQMEIELKVQRWILRFKTDKDWIDSLFANYPNWDDAGVAPKELYIILHAVQIAQHGREHIEFIRTKLRRFVDLPYPTNVVKWLGQISQKQFVHIGV